MAEFGEERPDWATRMLHLSDAMHREVRTWRLFAMTWTASGFTMSESVRARLQEHELAVARFAIGLDKKFSGGLEPDQEHVDEGLVYDEWESLKKSHGELSNGFAREADAYAREMKEKSGNWGTFTAVHK